MAALTYEDLVVALDTVRLRRPRASVVFRIIGFGFLFIGLFQVFFYLIDFYPLYLAAKAWFPAIAALITYGLLLGFLQKGGAYRYTLFMLVSMLYFLLTASIASNSHFHQPILYGLAAEAKVVPLCFYFVAFYAFKKWRMRLPELELVIAVLACITLVIGVSLEMFAEAARFYTEDGIFVKFDAARGYRYNVPLVFIELYVLIVFRSAMERKSWAIGLGIVPFLAYLVWAAEQRLALLGLVLVMVLAVPGYVPRRYILLVVPSAVILAVGILVSTTSYYSIAELTGAWALRLSTVETILNFLGNDMARWTFGAGHLNPLLSTTLQDLYGPNFWPADVGWFGVLFEFGLAGVVLTLGLYYLIWRESECYVEGKAPASLLGFKDYCRKIILLSIFVPTIPFLSGIFATLLAIFVYSRLNLLSTASVPNRQASSRRQPALASYYRP